LDKKALALVLLSMIALLGSFVYSYFFPTQNFFSQIPFTVTTIGYFLSGILFFGYLAFIPSIFLGLQLGAEKNAAIFLYLIPLIISTYAGAKTGFLLQEDFMKKKSFFSSLKKIILLLLIALILAFIVESMLPMIIELWPKEDLFGMKLVQGNNISDIFNDFSKIIRR
jgi:hypothetical protein